MYAIEHTDIDIYYAVGAAREGLTRQDCLGGLYDHDSRRPRELLTDRASSDHQGPLVTASGVNRAAPGPGAV